MLSTGQKIVTGVLGSAQVPPAGFTFILDSDGNRLLGSDGQYLFGVAF